MWSIRKRKSGSQLGDDKHTCIRHSLTSLKFGKATTKLHSLQQTYSVNVLHFGSITSLKKAFETTPLVAQK